jgi:hypothetical protein
MSDEQRRAEMQRADSYVGNPTLSATRKVSAFFSILASSTALRSTALR